MVHVCLRRMDLNSNLFSKTSLSNLGDIKGFDSPGFFKDK